MYYLLEEKEKKLSSSRGGPLYIHEVQGGPSSILGERSKVYSSDLYHVQGHVMRIHMHDPQRVKPLQ